MSSRAVVVLAVDPGPTRWGWAIIAIVFGDRGTTIQWVAGDHETWSVSLHLRLLDRALDEARRRDADVLVVSEIVTGVVYAGRRDANVLDTSRACGRATPVAEVVALLFKQGRLTATEPQPAITTAEYNTHAWHGVLTRYEHAPQEVINMCVRAVIAELPPLPKTRNGSGYAEHIYDACGLAIAAGHVLRGRKVVPLPDRVAMKVTDLISQDRTARAVKRKIKRDEESGAAVRLPVVRAGRPRGSKSAKRPTRRA